MPAVAVIGAGPAGLSAAYHLEHDDYVVLEKESAPGGLCRSFELGGAVFDFGGHAFYTSHEYVQDLITKRFGVELYRQRRRAYVYSHGTYLPYPFQMHLHGLPTEVVKECLVGLYEAGARGQGATPENLGQWIDQSFGAGIARHFLRPYNRKLWAHPLEEVTFEWTPRRVVAADVEAIIAGAISPVAFENFPNVYVDYPAEGGYFKLYEGFLDVVGDRLHQATVARVNLTERTVWTSTGDRLTYDYLISTMPLNELIAVAEDAPPCCREAAANLRHNSLYLVNLVFDRPQITDKHRVYSADPSIPFHKLVLNSNASPDLRKRPTFGIQGEVSFSPHKHVSRDGLEDWFRESLIRIGIVDPDDRVVASSVVTLRYGYPVYTSETGDLRQHLREELEARNVLCVGRFGEWMYLCSDDAVMRSKTVAESLNAKLGRRRRRRRTEGAVALGGSEPDAADRPE